MVMGLFGKTKIEERVENLDRALKESFARVKHDTETVYQWLQYLNNQLLQQQQLIERQQHVIDDQEDVVYRLRQELRELREALVSRLSPESVKRLVDEHYNLGQVLERFKRIEERLDRIEAKKGLPEARAERAVPKARIRDRLVQKLSRNSKEYVKNVIVNLINKYGRISAMQLREMIVEEQGLVSRSSFYRILEELEEESDLQVVSKGKEKVYVAGGTSRLHYRKT